MPRKPSIRDKTRTRSESGSIIVACLILLFTSVPGLCQSPQSTSNELTAASIAERLHARRISLKSCEPLNIVGVLRIIVFEDELELYFHVGGSQVVHNVRQPQSNIVDKIDLRVTNDLNQTYVSLDVTNVSAFALFDAICQKANLPWEIRSEGVFVDVADGVNHVVDLRPLHRRDNGTKQINAALQASDHNARLVWKCRTEKENGNLLFQYVNPSRTDTIFTNVNLSLPPGITAQDVVDPGQLKLLKDDNGKEQHLQALLVVQPRQTGKFMVGIRPEAWSRIRVTNDWIGTGTVETNQ